MTRNRCPACCQIVHHQAVAVAPWGLGCSLCKHSPTQANSSWGPFHG